MELGGITNNPRMHFAFRIVGLVAPTVVGIYLFLIGLGVVDSRYEVDTTFTLVFAAIWLSSAVFQYFLAKPNLLNAGVRVGTYHMLAPLYLIFFDGLSSPISSLWVVLAIVTYGYFGFRGLAISLTVLLGTLVGDILLHPTSLIISQDLAFTSSYFTIIFVLVYLMRFQERDEKEFLQAKHDELLQRDSILTLVNNMTDAVLSTDRSGIVNVYNAASLSLLDTNDNLVGKQIDTIVALQDENDNPFSLFDHLKKSHTVTMTDNLHALIADEMIRLEITYAPIRGSYSKSKQTNSEDGYIVIMRDVTKLKSLEEERDEFISVVSHELRTPITIAEGTISNAQLMFKRDDIHDDMLKKGLDQAHEQVVFLAKMVNDLSTLSRAERGVADNPEEIDVKQLMHQLWTSYSPEAEEKGLRFNLDAKGKLGHVMASRLYLHELLQNFITNSIKYTKEGSVTLSVVKQKNNHLLFTVKDTGIGISNADQAKIFKKFYRSEDYRTRETGGTGLGLYVALKLAKKLGCQIKLQSRLNHGSSFSFTLPLKKD